ncbi:type I 3-dehydroquinase-domain-containing protein [Lophiotrema nucula]|uniref:Type I 3-dehydroquinase-domain-containing protein n=1 Tax=Lophiotrema nucula TaxID=690887 RepID=A0A6A5ZHA0_9PLEO|nr:type I 3-dehydroquinase-domain-containing protein [Lophiotrema nucula]
MATMIQAERVATTRLKGESVIDVREIPSTTKPALLIIHGDEEEDIVGIFADVLGQSWEPAVSVDEVRAGPKSTIFSMRHTVVGAQLDNWDRSRVVINAHCVDGRHPRDDVRAEHCDFEYLYTKQPFFQRDVARFLGFVLGQIDPHRDLARKARTTLISTTFPDVHAALPNLDILSVGADAIELRVDLLEEPLPDGSFNKIPSLKYVGEQLMLLRQRTELPIIYTTRCTRENGRFPMDDPNLFYKYLTRAIQWGCEYIDVELWLPEDIRRGLAEKKGNSKIISAFHDFSGTFKWTAPETQQLFEHGAVYGDVVKMYALVSSMQDNYELEYFRSTIQTKYPYPPFSGLNMGPMGQLSRTLNKIFTPITHPLLPLIAAPGQLSAAEINIALHSMGQMPKLDIYGIGTYRSTSQAMFFEKCFNELSLPHQFMFAERAPKASIENIMRRNRFGGAFVNPPLASTAAYLPALSTAARTIGQVDTVLVRTEGGQPAFIGENASWKGIRATLSRDFVPSAYSGRAALLLANAEADASASIYALKSLGIGPIYTIGFKTHGSLAADVEPVRSVDDVKRLEQPFVIISALPAEKSLLVVPLLNYYRVDGRNGNSNSNGHVLGNSGRRSAGKVFVDLASGPRKADPLTIATSAGWTAYGIADVSAWTTVETLRLLVGQNVCYDFVRLASGRGLY